MRHEAVIFDLFGTLVQSFWEGHEDCLSDMASALGVSPEDFARAWSETCGERLVGTIPTVADNLRIIAKALGVNPDEGRIKDAVEIREGFVRGRLTPRPESQFVLKELRARELSLGLMSDCSPEVPRLWEETSLSGFFDATAFSSIIGLRKPNPLMYEALCDALGVRPEQCLYVGDGGNNELQGAAVLGMTAILVQHSDNENPDPYTTEAKTWQGPRIEDLREVLRFLE